MNAPKTIDLKGLDHGRREELIFPNVESLAPGEALRLVVEFNPVPLVFMLKAREGFEVAYEKEGPDEWILRVLRTGAKPADPGLRPGRIAAPRASPRTDRQGKAHTIQEEPGRSSKEHLKRLLKELKNKKVSKEAKKKAKEFFRTADAKTVGEIEAEIIREGVPQETVRTHLCDIHLEVMRESLAAKKVEPPVGHPIHTLMEEHKVILEKLRELSAAVKRLKRKTGFKSLGKDEAALQDIAHHLVEAERHHQREEEALFPALRKHGISEPPDIMELDHAEFKKRKHELHEIASRPRNRDFKTYKRKIVELGGYLAKELDSHIFKEDNILYQIALQTLTPEEWAGVKAGCDKIGYCCFTPKAAAEGPAVELELRSLPFPERHGRIFAAWEGLRAGQTLRIVNDHDPSPLRYQFDAEHRGAYSWKYVQEGPEAWIVDIAKTKEAPKADGLRGRVESAVARVRPMLQMDGGDVEIVDVDDAEKVVRVRLVGACSGCPSAGATLQLGVEKAIRNAAPEVKRVLAV